MGGQRSEKHSHCQTLQGSLLLKTASGEFLTSFSPAVLFFWMHLHNDARFSSFQHHFQHIMKAPSVAQAQTLVPYTLCNIPSCFL